MQRSVAAAALLPGNVGLWGVASDSDYDCEIINSANSRWVVSEGAGVPHPVWSNLYNTGANVLWGYDPADEAQLPFPQREWPREAWLNPQPSAKDIYQTISRRGGED